MPRQSKILRRIYHIHQRSPLLIHAHRALPQPLPRSELTRDDFPTRDLRPQAHEPQLLVDAAINSFSDRSRLTPRQEHARRQMVGALLRTMKPPYRTHTLENLEMWARWVDAYFFMGTLMTCQGVPRAFSPHRIVRMLPATAEEERRGHKFLVEHRDRRRFEIRVNVAMLAAQEDWAFGTGAALAGVVRALAAAYLEIFGCVCRDVCYGKMATTYGLTGQGYCWQVLMAKVVEEIRGWDYRLRKFANHRADENCIDQVAWAREARHWNVMFDGEGEGKRQMNEVTKYDTKGEYGIEFKERRVAREDERPESESEFLNRGRVVKRSRRPGGETMRKDLELMMEQTKKYRRRGPRVRWRPQG